MFVDGTGAQVEVALWDKAHLMFDSLNPGTGVVVVGCNATTTDTGEVKLNIWHGAHITTASEQAQSLTRLETETLTTETLTAAYSPNESLKNTSQRRHSQRALWRWQMLTASKHQ